jgi:hypothetical protein
VLLAKLRVCSLRFVSPKGFKLRIPTKKIVHSELMTISSTPKDAVESIVERVIVMGQEKGSG